MVFEFGELTGSSLVCSDGIWNYDQAGIPESGAEDSS